MCSLHPQTSTSVPATSTAVTSPQRNASTPSVLTPVSASLDTRRTTSLDSVPVRHSLYTTRHQLCCLTSSIMLSYVIICVHTLIFVAVLYLCCQFHHFATVHKFCFHKLILVLLKVTIYVGIRLITVAKSCLRIIPLYR